MRHHVEELRQIQVSDPIARRAHHLPVQPTQGIMTAPPRPNAIGGRAEPRLIDCLQDAAGQLLHDLVLDAADPQGTHHAVLLGDLNPSYRLRPVRHLARFLVQDLEVCLKLLPILLFGDSINAERFPPIQRLEACSQVVHYEVVHQGCKRYPWLPTSPSGDRLDAPVVAVAPPLCVDGVAFESAPACAPLCSAGVTPRPGLMGHPTSDVLSGVLPVCRLYRPTPR
jgi:hypothetical protein